MSKTFLFTVEYKLPAKEIENLLDSASRGSSYWCSSSLGYASETKKLIKGEDVKMYDHEGERNLTLNLKKVYRGMQIFAKKHPESFADWLKGDYDMNIGDLFLQICLFGKEKYA